MTMCKKLSRKTLRDFAQTVIGELGLTNNEVMLHLYGGRKLCPDCNRPHQFIDRFCPGCGILPHKEEKADD